MFTTPNYSTAPYIENQYDDYDDSDASAEDDYDEDEGNDGNTGGEIQNIAQQNAQAIMAMIGYKDDSVTPAKQSVKNITPALQNMQYSQPQNATFQAQPGYQPDYNRPFTQTSYGSQPLTQTPQGFSPLSSLSLTSMFAQRRVSLAREPQTLNDYVIGLRPKAPPTQPTFQQPRTGGKRAAQKDVKYIPDSDKTDLQLKVNTSVTPESAFREGLKQRLLSSNAATASGVDKLVQQFVNHIYYGTDYAAATMNTLRNKARMIGMLPQ